MPSRPPSVLKRLFDEGYTFDFFQAVRLLGLCQPSRTPVGRFDAPAVETVRFQAHASPGFPPSRLAPLC